MDIVPEKKTVSVNFSHAVSSLLDFLTLKMGPIGCLKMSVKNYHSELHDISEEWWSHMILWRCRLHLALRGLVQHFIC